jgi:hypothetical protein
MHSLAIEICLTRLFISHAFAGEKKPMADLDDKSTQHPDSFQTAIGMLKCPHRASA